MRHRRVALTAALALAAFAGLRGRLRRYRIAEVSMRPSLEPGDYVIARYRSSPLVRGDVVIFEHPQQPGFELVKRAIGLPGELVSISNGQVHIDRRVLAESWADGPTLTEGKWKLDGDEVFVLGDSRSVSSGDSRTIGPIPQDGVRWIVEIRYWPFGSAGRV